MEQPLAAFWCNAHMAKLLQPGEGGVNHAGAGSIKAACEVFNGFDQFVAMAGGVIDEAQSQQAQVAMLKPPSSPASSPAMMAMVMLKPHKTAPMPESAVVIEQEMEF